MAGKKAALAAKLDASSQKPALRRGAGMRLSHEDSVAPGTPEETQKRRNAETQKRRNAETPNPAQQDAVSPPFKRVNRGYQLREDLIKQLRRIALDEDRTLYAVMEEAFEEYVARRAGHVS